MDLQIALMRLLLATNKEEDVSHVEHSESERSLIFRAPSYEIVISGEIYDRLQSAETLSDVEDVYESIAYN